MLKYPGVRKGSVLAGECACGLSHALGWAIHRTRCSVSFPGYFPPPPLQRLLIQHRRPLSKFSWPLWQPHAGLPLPLTSGGGGLALGSGARLGARQGRWARRALSCASKLFLTHTSSSVFDTLLLDFKRPEIRLLPTLLSLAITF